MPMSSGQAAALRALLGGLAGGYAGHEITPKLFGYADDPSAVAMSTGIDAATLAALAAMGPSGIRAATAGKPMAIPGIAAGMIGSELVPVGRKAVTDMVEAAQYQPPTATDQLEKFVNKPSVRGAGMGAGIAGVGALISGLLRSRSDNELEQGTGRMGMAGKDFLKYLIPAMLAGGVMGSFKDQG